MPRVTAETAKNAAMADRRRLLLLLALMGAVAAGVGLSAIAILYDAAFDQQRARLVETVKSQARLIEAIARFDRVRSQDGLLEDWKAATLSQVADSHGRYEGFGKTGEFTLAQREGDQIVFQLSHRHFDLDHPKPVPLSGELAEPMRRALMGESGTLVGLDYRGATVLAAYEPVHLLDLGVVAKIDLAEVREPFVRAALLTGFAAVTLVMAAAMFFLRLSRPVLRRLDERAERIRAILAAAPQAIITIGERGTIESFNPAAERIFGYTLAEVIGSNVSLLMPSPHREQHDRSLARFLETGEAGAIGRRREIEARRKDGTTFPLEIAVAEARAGGKRSFIGFAADLTDDKRAEEDFARQAAQLQRAQKLEAVGQLAGGIAHDFGNIVTGIAMASGILLDRLERDDPARELGAEISAAAQRAKDLIRQLLVFARSQAVEDRVLDLNDGVREIAALLERLVGEDISLDLDLAPEVGSIRGDPAEVYQVVMNLVLNARDAMPNGGAIQIATANVDAAVIPVANQEGPPGGLYVVLQVQDTGAGMDGLRHRRTRRWPRRGRERARQGRDVSRVLPPRRRGGGSTGAAGAAPHAGGRAAHDSRDRRRRGGARAPGARSARTGFSRLCGGGSGGSVEPRRAGSAGARPRHHGHRHAEDERKGAGRRAHRGLR
jgi:PAS domain S-box-containing protein